MIRLNLIKFNLATMVILSIDTSCDETSVAVTNKTEVLSNVIWSQSSLHARFGGVLPSLAQRMHEERIGFVVDKAIKSSKLKIENLDCIAVTVGPGLSIALGVGVNKAKELAKKYKKPLVPVNHVEAHILSAFANPKSKTQNPKQYQNSKFNIPNSIFPAYGLCVSGKNTLLVLVENIGKYKILADTQDDALGEALDKAARMLGLGYPGGHLLEDFAKKGDLEKFSLPIPLRGQENRQIFSYSGLKTSFYRLIDANKSKNQDFPLKQDTYDLAATFQDSAFKHILHVLEFRISKLEFPEVKTLLLGGGVAQNTEFRKRLRKLLKNYGINLFTPYSNKLYGDNAAMIGVCAYLKLKAKNLKLKDYVDYSKIDRNSRLKLTDNLVV